MKATSAVGILAAGVLVLAACTGDDTGGDASPAGETSTGGVVGQVFDPDREPPAAPINGAVAGGTVTVLTDDEPDTLDPTGAYYATSSIVLQDLVTRSLTQYVYDPAQAAMVLVPDIATDLGTPNADFTKWTFTIRDGVRFEDGTEVTADDVAFGIKRSFDRTAFPGAASYSNDYFLDGDSYDGPYEDGTDYPGVVVDGDTLTLTMDRPFPDMPFWASFAAMGPIPEQGSEPPGYALHPQATGPYKIAAYTPHKSLILVRNDQWDPDTDPGRHAYPDRYVFRFNQPVERIDATILGDSTPAQTMVSNALVLADDFEKASRLDRVTVGPGSCTFGYELDYLADEIEVRQAIGYAYPYQGHVKASGGVPGVTILLGESSLLPPGFPARHQYSVLDTDAGHSDPDKAKALLKAAGYAPGEYELAWPYDTSDPIGVQITERMVKAFEAAGFQARPHSVDSFDELLAMNPDPDAPINMRFLGWCSDWPSGNSWLPLFFHSDGNLNFSGFSEPSVDAEIERIAALPLDEQPAEWGDLDETIMTDYYPAVITNYNGVATLHGSRIDGVYIDNLAQGPGYKDLHIIP